MTTLFLFAHQDDEMGVFHEISKIVKAGDDINITYLTNGEWGGTSTETRMFESSDVLTRLGVRKDQIDFLGTRLGNGDATLVDNLERTFDALKNKTADMNVTRIVMQAWEGGHPDHDACHLLGVALAKHLGLLSNSFQFGLYRNPASRHLVTFCKPLEENGDVFYSRISLKERVYHMYLLTRYRSQWWVMLKLGAHMAWNYIFDGKQYLQPISVTRISQAPMPGQLLYEFWSMNSADAFNKAARPFLKSYIRN